jgi:hypothetical protein
VDLFDAQNAFPSEQSGRGVTPLGRADRPHRHAAGFVA